MSVKNDFGDSGRTHVDILIRQAKEAAQAASNDLLEQDALQRAFVTKYVSAFLTKYLLETKTSKDLRENLEGYYAAILELTGP